MDWHTFIAIFVGVVGGSIFGYGSGLKQGWIAGAAKMITDYPLINVEMERVSSDTFRFYYVLDNSFILQGTIDECSRKILGDEPDEDDPRRIIFAEFSR